MEILQGKASDILRDYAEGHYYRSFNENGRIVLVEKDTNNPFLPSQEVEHYLEVIIGYDYLADLVE